MIKIDSKNISLINFSDIFTQNIDIQFLDDLHSLNLIINNEVSLSKRDVKRLLHHRLIYGACEYVRTAKVGSKIVIVCSGDFKTADFQIYDFFQVDEIYNVIISFFKSIKKYLPLNVLFVDITFGAIKNNLDERTGKGSEIISIAESIVYNHKKISFTFNKIKKFAEKNGLKFISSHYFNDIKSRQLIFSA